MSSPDLVRPASSSGRVNAQQFILPSRAVFHTVALHTRKQTVTSCWALVETIRADTLEAGRGGVGKWEGGGGGGGGGEGGGKGRGGGEMGERGGGGGGGGGEGRGGRRGEEGGEEGRWGKRGGGGEGEKGRRGKGGEGRREEGDGREEVEERRRGRVGGGEDGEGWEEEDGEAWERERVRVRNIITCIHVHVSGRWQLKESKYPAQTAAIANTPNLHPQVLFTQSCSTTYIEGSTLFSIVARRNSDHLIVS